MASLPVFFLLVAAVLFAHNAAEAFSNPRVVLDFSYSLPSVYVTYDLDGSGDTKAAALAFAAQLELQEGYLPPRPLDILATTYRAGVSVSWILRTTTHLTTNARVSYRLNDTSTAAVVTPSVARVGTAPIGAIPKPTQKVCSSSSVFERYTPVITEWAEVVQLVENLCTTWTGSIHLESIDREPEEWAAAFAYIVEVEGYLVLHNVTNFSPTHLPLVTHIASALPQVLYEGTYGLRITNSTNMGVIPDPFSLYSAVRSGVFSLEANPGMCIAGVTDTWWDSNSRVEVSFRPADCASTECPFFVSADSSLCSTTCDNPLSCPTICSGGLVTQASDFARFSTCNRISGSLVISDLPSVDELAFLEAFEHVTMIDGTLSIIDNDWLVSLQFLPALERVSSIILQSNPRLVDARLPALRRAGYSGSTSISNCPRLCESAHPLGTLACSDVILNFEFVVANLKQSQFIAQDFSAVFALVSQTDVSDIASSFSSDGETGIASVTVSVDSSVDASLDVIALALHAIQRGEFPRRLASIRNGFAYADIVMATFPLRLPGSDTTSDFDMVLSAQFAQKGIVLDWTQPTGANESSFTSYRIEYAPRLSLPLIEDFADFVDGLAINSLDPAILLHHAEGALSNLYSFQSLSVGQSLAGSVLYCQQIIGDTLVEATENCLLPNIRYEFKAAGFASNRQVASNSIFETIEDFGLILSDLGAEALSSTEVRFTWSRPTAPTVYPTTILGYQLQVWRTAQDYNGIDGEDGDIADEAFEHELFDPTTRQRIYVQDSRASPAQQHTIASDCLYDYQGNQTYCLKPWTTYKLLIRTRASYYGSLSTVLFTTQMQAPTTPPTIESHGHGGSSTSYTLNLQRPVPLTTVVNGFTIEYSDPNDQNGTIFHAIASPRAAQKNNATEIISVVVPGLKAYTLYRFEVVPVTESGLGEPAILSARTDETVPDVLSPVTIREETSAGASISWLPPIEAPGVIVRYEFIYNDDYLATNGSAFASIPGSQTQATLQLDSRLVRIRAVTSKGAGPWSDLPISSSGSSNAFIGLISRPEVASGLAVGVVLLLSVCTVIFVRRRSSRLKANAMTTAYVPPEADQWEYDPRLLALGRELGQGAFGVVHEGVVHGIRDIKGTLQVAVKQCGGGNDGEPSVQDINDFLQEAELMKSFSDPHHTNVVRLLGVVTQQRPIMIITEFMENGDLKSFLERKRPTRGAPSSLTLCDLIYMAADVAAGMKFLASKKFVHRDLACRNCLVASDLTTKVADFGLSRRLNYTDYYRKSGEALLPIRWMDPNALCSGKYTVETDVWSMGVVLWELMSFGRMPYSGWSNAHVFENVIKGKRLTQPPGSPDGAFDIMWDCWQLSDRPTFDEIEERLMEIGRCLQEGVSNEATRCTVGGELGLVAVDENQRNHINEETGMSKQEEQLMGERYMLADEQGSRAAPQAGKAAALATGVANAQCTSESYLPMKPAQAPVVSGVMDQSDYMRSPTQRTGNSYAAPTRTATLYKTRAAPPPPPAKGFNGSSMQAPMIAAEESEEYIPAYCDMSNANVPLVAPSRIATMRNEHLH